MLWVICVCRIRARGKVRVGTADFIHCRIHAHMGDAHAGWLHSQTVGVPVKGKRGHSKHDALAVHTCENRKTNDQNRKTKQPKSGLYYEFHFVAHPQNSFREPSAIRHSLETGGKKTYRYPPLRFSESQIPSLLFHHDVCLSTERKTRSALARKNKCSRVPIPPSIFLENHPPPPLIRDQTLHSSQITPYFFQETRAQHDLVRNKTLP